MLDDKTLIMTVSTGRSGTGLLAKLFELAEDMTSVHEPVPTFQDVFEDGQASPEAALSFARDVKLPDIAKAPTRFYAETSHYFGQGFLEAFIALAVPFKLVILNRDMRSVAKSFERIKCIPMRTEKGASLMPHPDKKSALPLEDWQSLSDYQLCYWYCLETEARKELAKDQAAAAGVPVVEVLLEDLQDFDRFSAFMDALGLTLRPDAKEAHAELATTKVNRKGKYLPKLRMQNLDGPEAEVWERVARAKPEIGPELAAAVERRYGAA